MPKKKMSKVFWTFCEMKLEERSQDLSQINAQYNHQVHFVTQ